MSSSLPKAADGDPLSRRARALAQGGHQLPGRFHREPDVADDQVKGFIGAGLQRVLDAGGGADAMSARPEQFGHDVDGIGMILDQEDFEAA